MKKVAFEDLTEDAKRMFLDAADPKKHRKICLRKLSPEELKKKEEEKRRLIEKFNIKTY